MPVPNIHILGIQGSGKGTQSSLLVEKYGLTYISSGNLFRQRAAQGDERGAEVGKKLKAGQLLPDQDLFDIVDEYLQRNPVSRGFLGDGVIRTASQYSGLQAIWNAHGLDVPFLIHLELSEQVALERIEHRIQEQSDPGKFEYHRIYSGKLVHRDDDNPLAIQERFSLFHKLTTPVIDMFKEEGRCVDISADQTIEQIHAQICETLEKHYPSLRHGTD